MTCVALVRGATWEAQEVYTGYLGEVATLDDDWHSALDPDPPTMAIIGAVAGFADQLAWHGRAPTPLTALLAPLMRSFRMALFIGACLAQVGELASDAAFASTKASSPT